MLSKFSKYFILIILSAPVNSQIYVYERADGSKLITDQKQHNKNYVLQKKYKTNAFSNSNKNQIYYAQPIKSQYDSIIKTYEKLNDIEPWLLKSVIHVESAFQRFAISHAGAMGLMQLMPQTASIYQLDSNQFDPEKNIAAGSAHLKMLLDKYKNKKKLALAAYNAGESAVKKYNGIPPYKETQEYVKKVLSLQAKYKRLAQ